MRHKVALHEFLKRTVVLFINDFTETKFVTKVFNHLVKVIQHRLRKHRLRHNARLPLFGYALETRFFVHVKEVSEHDVVCVKNRVIQQVVVNVIGLSFGNFTFLVARWIFFEITHEAP